MSASKRQRGARRVMDPMRFVVFPPLELDFRDDAAETLVWEIFQGRLLDASATRERRTFESWSVFIVGANEALISLKFDPATDEWHVTRAILSYAHEAYEEGSAILTRETQKWVRELVGTTTDTSNLSKLVFQAVVGTSRLPLMSLEAPLPQFALGQLGYEPMEGRDDKYVELLLRSSGPLPGDVSIEQLRRIYLGVSLSPYTHFVKRTIELLRAKSPAERVEFLGWLLRLQWRHLNAYDLHIFHHRGANYPDALLVDEVLREYVGLATDHPELFAGRLPRRALRLGWLLRTLYAGHLVPEQPTSPGENLRVLPEPFARVPDEQIFNPYRRPRTLFDRPLDAPPILSAVIGELADPLELRELGAALLLDRPFGETGPLVSYVARSRKLIARHLATLIERGVGLPPGLQPVLLDLPGVELRRVGRPIQPGVISLDDAFQSADDFVVERTTASTLAELRSFVPSIPAAATLVLPAGDGWLAFDGDYRAI